MNRRRLLAAAAAALPALCASRRVSAANYAHPFHATSLELEWNPETGCFEAALRLPGPPLDEELARIAERPVALDSPDLLKRQQNERILEDWVRRRFKLTAKDLPHCEIHWVGVETELRSVWAYFEVRLQPQAPEQPPAAKSPNTSANHPPDKHPPCPVDELTLHCRFFEHLQGQVNAATIRLPDRRGSLILTEILQSAAVNWSPAKNP